MKHVDTGTGLERVASVLQSLETNAKPLGNYDIDVFQTIIESIEEVARRTVKVRCAIVTRYAYGDRRN